MFLKVFSFQQLFKAFRFCTALLMFIHGVYRWYAGGVPQFGSYLESQGLIAGVTIAWILTVTEIVASCCLATGRIVLWSALFFVAELITGIIMVHGKAGWFVVGYGRNGMEYSVLLILSFILIMARHYTSAEKGR